MQIKRFGILSLWLLFAFSAPLSAADAHATESHGEESSLKDEIKAEIKHHLKDSHSFHLWGKHEEGTYVGFPLPVILWNEGLHFFMSSKFDHEGHQPVASKGNYYHLYHSKIYRTNEAGELNYDGDHHVINEQPLDFSITKTVFSTIVISIFIFWIFTSVAKNYRHSPVPRGLTKFMEPLILFVRDDIARPNIGEKHYRKYMGYLLTVFFFVWIANLFGQTSLGINITGNIAVTFGLALITFIITQFSGNKHYWQHIFWMPGVPYPMRLILAPIELLGLIIKPFSLLIRLYANISAGHVVIYSLIGLLFIFSSWFARGAFFGLSLFLAVIELLVAFLQAYIFTMLSALYFGAAVEEQAEH